MEVQNQQHQVSQFNKINLSVYNIIHSTVFLYFGNLNERNFSFMNIKNQNKFQILNPKPIFPRIDK